MCTSFRRAWHCCINQACRPLAARPGGRGCTPTWVRCILMWFCCQLANSLAGGVQLGRPTTWQVWLGSFSPTCHAVPDWLVNPAGPWACHMGRQSWVLFTPEGRREALLCVNLIPAVSWHQLWSNSSLQSARCSCQLRNLCAARGCSVPFTRLGHNHGRRICSVVGPPNQAVHDQHILAEEQVCHLLGFISFQARRTLLRLN